MIKTTTKFRLAAIIVFTANITLSGFAQEQLSHPIKMFKSNDGKTYINKSQPMYLWLSNTPNEDDSKIRIESEQHKKYSNPFYFDTEGYNTIRTPSQVDTVTKKVVYPIQDIIFEVYADSRAPYTKLSYEGSKTYVKNKKIYVTGSTKTMLTANDQLSGVDKTLISINKEPFKEYNGQITLTKEDEYFIQFYSVDNVGNIEKIRSEIIIVDLTMPKTSINIKKDRHENIVSGQTAIEIDVIESGSGVSKIYYKLDNKTQKKYIGPILTKYLSEGDHIIEYWAVDNVGNEEKTNSFSFYVDKIPPMIVEEILGNKFIANNIENSSGRSKHKVTAMENKAGAKEIFYSINNGEKKEYTAPFYLEGNKGNIAIKIFASDNVNNQSSSGQTNQTLAKTYVDLAGPVLTYKFNGSVFADRDTIFIKNDTKINLIGNDKESGMDYIEYKINNGETKRYENSFSIENEGLHNIFFTGYDKVGNSNNAETILVVDVQAPEINENFSVLPIGSKTIHDKKMDVYPNHVTLFLSATDDKAGLKQITYKLNNAPSSIYSKPLSNFTKGSDVKVEIIAIDKLGNEFAKTIEFSVN